MSHWDKLQNVLYPPTDAKVPVKPRALSEDCGGRSPKHYGRNTDFPIGKKKVTPPYTIPPTPLGYESQHSPDYSIPLAITAITLPQIDVATVATPDFSGGGGTFGGGGASGDW